MAIFDSFPELRLYVVALLCILSLRGDEQLPSSNARRKSQFGTSKLWVENTHHYIMFILALVSRIEY